MVDWHNTFIDFLRLRRAAIKRDFNRVLPFGDYISDRWEKAEALGFGKGSSVYDTAHIFGSVSIGENTWIGPFTILDGSAGLSIGSYCAISAGCHIYTHDTVKWCTSGGVEPFAYAPVKIGDRCYIGPNAIITKGVTIGDGAIVGANSLVMQDVPANSTAVGSPSKIISR